MEYLVPQYYSYKYNVFVLFTGYVKLTIIICFSYSCKSLQLTLISSPRRNCSAPETANADFLSGYEEIQKIEIPSYVTI